MLPLINRHLQLYTKSKYGKDLHITAKFNPIDIPTQETKASINTSLASMVSQLVSAGVISPEEAREKLQADEFAGFNFIDASNAPENDQEQDQEEVAKFMESLNAKQAQSENNKGETPNS